MSRDDWEALFEAALYASDPVERDQARGFIAQRAHKTQTKALIALLDAHFRATRRRAARILSEMRVEAVGPWLDKALVDSACSPRVRAHAGRILGLLAPQDHPALALGLHDPEARVRRACACEAAPIPALVDALKDDDVEVVERASLALNRRGGVSEESLREALAHHPQPPDTLVRLAAEHLPVVVPVDRTNGGEAFLDYLEDESGLREIQEEAPVTAAWGFSRLGVLDTATARDPDPRIRSALARGEDPNSPLLASLLADEDPGVAWLARRAQAGDLTVEKRRGCLGPHGRSEYPSAQPPYGLHKGHGLKAVERSKAALALCHTRLDVNLGVAMRSAEAAGLEAIWLVGRNAYLRSPARGTDHVLEMRHAPDAAALVRMAREGDYQIVAIQQTPDSVPYHVATYPPRPLFVMGSEDAGLPHRIRLEADLVVEIPMYGLIDSLNMAAAATTVLFHWRTQRDGMG